MGRFLEYTRYVLTGVEVWGAGEMVQNPKPLGVQKGKPPGGPPLRPPLGMPPIPPKGLPPPVLKWKPPPPPPPRPPPIPPPMPPNICMTVRCISYVSSDLRNDSTYESRDQCRHPYLPYLPCHRHRTYRRGRRDLHPSRIAHVFAGRSRSRVLPGSP